MLFHIYNLFIFNNQNNTKNSKIKKKTTKKHIDVWSAAVSLSLLDLTGKMGWAGQNFVPFGSNPEFLFIKSGFV